MNKVIHFEIPANDMERADDFYEKVFGWKIDKASMGDMQYHLTQTVPVDENDMPKEMGAINGALMEKDGVVGAPVLTIGVPDIKAHMEKIEENGGKILMSVQTVKGMGLYARFTDTEGNVMAIWQHLPEKHN